MPTNCSTQRAERNKDCPAPATTEFHIFPSKNETFFELAMPDEDERIQFSSLFAAARHARKFQDERDAAIIIHDLCSNRVNRIPLKGRFEVVRA